MLSDKLTKEEIEKIENILIEKEGEDAMLHAQMVIRRDFEKAKEEGRREGMLHAQEVIRRDFEKAKKEEREKGIIEIAKKMLNEKVDIDFIIKITGLKKEQILN